MEWLDKEEAAGASSRLKREHMVRQKKLLSRPLIKQFLERVGDMEKVQVRPGCVAVTAARAALGSRRFWRTRQHELQVGPGFVSGSAVTAAPDEVQRGLVGRSLRIAVRCGSAIRRAAEWQGLWWGS